MSTNTFQSLKDLQLALPRILEEHGSDATLTKIALANPIIALQRAGYAFSEAAQEEIDNHIRFGKKDAAEFGEIKTSLHGVLGKDVALNDPVQVSARLNALKAADKGAAAALLQRYQAMNAEHPALAEEKDIPMILQKYDGWPITNIVFSMNRDKTAVSKTKKS
jgi:hypothetical protein